MLEVLVSLTLLMSVLSVSTPLIVRHGRLMTSQRQYRIGLDEVSNQLERLSALNEAELGRAIDVLTPSDFIAQRLPGAKLQGQLDATDLGRRLTVRLTWDGVQRGAATIAMAAWIVRSEQHAQGLQPLGFARPSN